MLRIITLTYSPIICVTDLMGNILQSSDLNETLASVIIVTATWIYTLAAYNLYIQSEKFYTVIDTMKQMIYSQLYNKNFSKNIYDYSRKIKVMIIMMWSLFCAVAIINVFMAFWYRDGRSASESTTKHNGSSLVFNSWYPYDEYKYPYYQISFVFELFRMAGTMNMITGNDCLFITLVFFIAELWLVLAENFENIYQNAQRNLKHTQDIITRNSSIEESECDDQMEEDINKLLKNYIKQHIALNR